MYNSFKRLNDILKDEPPLHNRLVDASHYLGHTHPNHKPESLEKHIDLVNDHLSFLTDSNGLDAVIDRLIFEFLSDNGISENKAVYLENFLKAVFIRTIVFHDFGKVNPNFQGDEEKMNNPLFKSKLIKNYVLKSHHSKLGAYLYLVSHFKEIVTGSFSPSEQRLLLFFALCLSYSIIRHHAKEILSPNAANIQFRNDELEAMQFFLKEYRIDLPEKLAVLSKGIFDEKALEAKLFKPFKEKLIKGNFSLYALARLNFSLLTAADYLATSEYMSGQVVKSLGLITDCIREKVIQAARSSKSYNSKAFELAGSSYVVENPLERSGDNLNTLRLNMAIEVLRTIRQNLQQRLFYLEAPTGGGKTNLSMLAVAELLKAHTEINKVFYVFPFTTLITQTHQVIMETLGLSESEISLLHAKAGFQTNAEDGDYGRKKLDYLNNLFVHYPFCLLTHIRFFDILKTNEKETNYLLHRLANSIVVIDELQSYPPRHWDKILYFIQQFAAPFNIQFVLMSATLPRIDKLKLPLANRITFTDLLPNAKAYFTNPNFADRVKFRFDYRNQNMAMDELSQIVLEKSKEYTEKHRQEGVFTIVEFIFKKSATEFTHAIGDAFFDNVFVLSGTILEPRRKEIINFLKNKANRNKKVLLITTQVVEAGVDIDMDLGFKNISLIDSDEQLAGRVNRNLLKEPCEVYLFQINQPSQLYKQDERYQITRDELSKEDHEEILKTKDFERLYDLVLSKINKVNSIEAIQNFNSDYLPEVIALNYKTVHQKFKLIEQENLSVFVPLNLPKQVLSKDGKLEDIFKKSELDFLTSFGVQTDSDCISGADVWAVYKNILFNKAKEFTGQQIDKKTISGILSQFTFSIFASRTIKRKLEVSFGIPHTDDENELRGFENYVYLARHEACYDYHRGLLETKLDDPENFIL